MALSQSMPLGQADLAALARMPFAGLAFPRESTILPAGETPGELYVVLDGVAARVATAPSGQRQILALLLPGDVFDWALYRLGAMVAPPERAVLEHAIVAIGGCAVGVARFQSIRKLLQELPQLAEAFERRAIREQAITREWILNVGGRRASARLGHLICEIYERLRSMGFAEDDSFRLPITQVHLSEALGLSSVHLNRELKNLRADGLLRLSAGVFVLPDLRRLERLSDFTSVYLNAGRSRRVVANAE